MIEKVAIIYDDSFKWTTGFYCKRALEKLGYLACHFKPDDIGIIPTQYDLYLNIDDNARYLIPGNLHPSAYWVIDTHTSYDWRLKKARMFDFVFAAQKDGANMLRKDGIKNVIWLPLACDPDLYKKYEAEKEYDISFIGNIQHSKKRLNCLNFLKKKLKDKNILIGQSSPEESALIYAKSKLIFNISIKNDINMRVFEALSCARALVTNDLRNNGQKELFAEKPPFIIYKSKRELLKKIKYYLYNEKERENIAKMGYEEALSKHTYVHRMREIVQVVTKKINYVKYADYDEDISVMDNIYGRVFDLIAENKKILDVGCATGRFSKYLISKKRCFVTGIEKNDQFAEKAREILPEVISGDVLGSCVYDKITQKYDFILLMDILEHTVNPHYVLLKLKDFLEEKGGIILSTPNIAYWAVRKDLLMGAFNYDPAGGLMDNEHVHFFTYDSIKSLIEKCGYTIKHFDMLYDFPVFNSQHAFFGRILKISCIQKILENIARRSPNFFAYQFLFVLEKATENESY